MKLTKKQFQELVNCHTGVGFIAYKSDKNAVESFEFYTDKKGDLRYNNDQLHPDKICLKIPVSQE